MATFDDFWKSLIEGLTALAKGTVKDFAKEATADGKAFLKKARADLERWTALLAAGQITAADLKFLVEGKADVAEMAALKEAGLALVKVEKFQRAVIDLVVNTAVDTLV